MLIRITVAFTLIAVLGLAFAFAVTPVSPATTAAVPDRPAPSLAASRLFALMPDGRVELSDGVGRRSYRWDGSHWQEIEAVRIAPASAEPE